MSTAKANDSHHRVVHIPRHVRQVTILVDDSSSDSDHEVTTSAAVNRPLTPPFAIVANDDGCKRQPKRPLVDAILAEFPPLKRTRHDDEATETSRQRDVLQQRFTPNTNQLNVHPRDARVRTDFTAERHDYYIDDVLCDATDQWYSPSGLMKFLWPPFDADQVAARCAHSSSNPRYAGRSAAEIKALWEQGRLDGQACHAAEDAWLQHLPLPTTADSLPPPQGFYRAMEALADRGFDVFRTEMSMFDEDLRLKGQTDLLLKDRATGRITVADHKHCRVESLRNEEAHGIGAIHPWSEGLALPDTRRAHYQFQLSLYHWILKRKYPEWPLSDELILINYSPLHATSFELVVLPVIDLEATGFRAYLPWNKDAALHWHFPGKTLIERVRDEDAVAGSASRVRLGAAPLAANMVWTGRAYKKRGLPESVWAHPWRWFQNVPYTAAGYYERHLLQNLGLLRRLGELVGKTLVCWCRPSEEKCACHVLVKYANLLEAGRITLPEDSMWAAAFAKT